jgi:lysophospholipase L1-like esterase
MTQAHDEPTRPRRRFRMRSKLLVAWLTGLLAFGIAEATLRVAGFSHPLPYYPDEVCGVRLQPGFRGWWSKEGAAAIAFRDREHSIDKPPGVIRVAVLGDSYVEAFQVPQSAMFGSVLERELNTQAADAGIAESFEVLSFGVSGYSTAQELLALRQHVWQFEPDIVLLAFLPANDVRGNSRALEPNDCRPFFDLIDGQLVPDFRFREDPAYQDSLTTGFRFKTAVINASRVAQLLYAVRSRPVPAEPDQKVDPAAVLTGQPPSEVGLDDECFRTPQTDEWEFAWQLSERLIEQFAREVSEHGSQFAVAVLTSSQQVDPNPMVRRAYAERLGVEDLSYADRRITELGERAGFPTIILSEPLGDFAERTGRFIHGFSNTSPGRGHWNKDGHREAALACTPPLLRLAADRFGVKSTEK